MKKSIYLSLYAGLALLGLPAVAEELAVRLTPEEALAYALEHNPELKVARQELARARVQQDYAGRLSNPELEIQFSNDAFGEDEGEQTFEVGLTQPIPVSSRLRKEKQLRNSQVALAEAVLAQRQLNLMHAVDQKIIQLAMIRKKITNQQQLAAVNREIVTFLKQQAERGEASTLDVTQAALTGSGLERETRVQQAAARQLEFGLKCLLGQDPETPLQLDAPLALPGQWQPETLTRQALLQRRPDHVLAQAEIDAAGQTLDLEKARRWDDISLKLFVEREEAVDEPGGVEENTIAGIGIALPLPLMQQNGEAVAMAAVEQQAASGRRQALERRIWSAYQQSRQSCTDKYQLARDINDNLIGLAKKNFDDLRRAYQQGQASLVQVQRAQEQVLDVEASALEALAAFFKSRAALRLIAADYPLPSNR